MNTNATGMVPLGYGKFVRADQIVAVVPIDEGERRSGRRTYVHLETLPEPIVASRSEQAILADIEKALSSPEAPHRRRLLGRRVPPERRRADAA